MSLMTTNEAALAVAEENKTQIEGIVATNGTQDGVIEDLQEEL